jgi:hypothetical protein
VVHQAGEGHQRGGGQRGAAGVDLGEVLALGVDGGADVVQEGSEDRALVPGGRDVCPRHRQDPSKTGDCLEGEKRTEDALPLREPELVDHTGPRLVGASSHAGLDRSAPLDGLVVIAEDLSQQVLFVRLDDRFLPARPGKRLKRGNRVPVRHHHELWLMLQRLRPRPRGSIPLAPPPWGRRCRARSARTRPPSQGESARETLE